MILDDKSRQKIEDIQPPSTAEDQETQVPEDEVRAKAAQGEQLDGDDREATAQEGQTSQEDQAAQKGQGTQKEQSAQEGQTAQKDHATQKAQSAQEDQATQEEQSAQGGQATQEEQSAQGGQSAAGGGSLPQFEAPAAQDASVGEPLPSSFQHSEQVLQSAQGAAAAPPSASPGTAAQPQAAREGWASKTVGFTGSVLHATFLDRLPMLFNSKGRGQLAKQFTDWSDVAKAKGWEKVPPSLDKAHDIVGTIGGFLGPLSMILGIVSYSRYVPIPPIPAIGSALYVISRVIKAFNLIMDIVKLVIAALRPIVDVIMIAVTRDPEKRKRYQERLKDNCMDLAMAGFTVAFKTMTDKGFRSGRAAARAAGKGRLGALRSGFKGMWAGKTQDLGRGMDMLRSIPKGRAVGLFRGTVDDAWNKAMAFRRLAYTQVSASRSAIAGVSAGRGGSVAVAAQRRSVSALRATVTGKGESMMRMASGTTGRVTMRSTQAASLRVGSGGITAVAGRSQSVTASALRSSRHMDWSRVSGVGREVMSSQVQGRMIRKTVSQAAGSLGPQPQAAPPVAPGIEAGSEQAAKATQDTVLEPDTPIFKDVPTPPEKTQTAPGQIEAIKQQREVMKSVGKELENDVVTAKAGQVEAKGAIKAAGEHKAATRNAQDEVVVHQQKLTQEKEGVQKGRQKVAEGKAKQAKGEQGFDKAGNEGDRARGSVPGGKVNRDDIPWYKKPFMWVVDKFEGARAKVMDAMTKAVMKAVEGATGLKDTSGKMAEADKQTQEQEAVLSSEPEVLNQVTSTVNKESQAATEGEQKATEKLTENQKAEKAATKAMDEVKDNESKLQAEEDEVKADAVQYDSTYGKSFEAVNKQTAAAAAGDLSPLDIKLNQEVAAIRDSVMKLIQAIKDHQGRVGAAAGQLSSEFKDKARDLPGDRKAQAESTADKLKTDFEGSAEKSATQRSDEVEELESSATQFEGKTAKADDIQDVSRIHGQVVGLARGFDEDKQGDLEEMHSTFTQQYDLLFD